MGIISKENPLLAHDLTEIRGEAIRTLASPFGEESLVDGAMKLFVSIRSHVAPHLYDDVVPCLEWLTKDVGVKVAVLTNGNANLRTCNVLGKFLTLSIGASDVGIMKPSPVPFMAISQRTGIPPSRILFIGDSLEKDVEGAKAVGMTAALILRTDYTDQRVVKIALEGTSSSREAAARLESTTITSVTIEKGLGLDLKGPLNDSLNNPSDEPMKDYIVLNTLYPDEFEIKVKNFLGKD
jgi:HAD superfamily hydrolase (TIGR01509 family)